MTFVHQEFPGMETQISPQCKNFVHWFICGVWKIAPQKSFEVLGLGGDGGIQLLDLVGAEPVELPKVKKYHKS